MTNDLHLHTIELFAGVGMLGEGLRAGLRHMGVETRTVCYVEREGFAASVMAARMAEGALDDAPVWSDVTTFDAAAWRGAVDCVIGGFPCQDLSLAVRRAGLDGKRSGLFFDLLRIAEDSGARYLFLENVAGIASATATVVDEAEGELEERAAARVLGELADRGWCAEWLTLSASEVGASHGRARWFCWVWRELADTPSGDGRELARTDQRGTFATEWNAAKCADVAHAQRAERRPLSVAGTGGQQGNDTGGREAHGRAGVADEVLGNTAGERCRKARQCGASPSHAGLGGAVTTVECEFCGHEFPEHLGRYGCPNCEGAGLADTEGHGRHEGRTESGGEQGRSDAAECSGAMAYAQRQCRQRRGIAGNVACAGCTAEDQTRQREWCGTAADGCGQPMADPCSPRRQGAELAGACAGHRGGGRKHMDQLANFVAHSTLDCLHPDPTIADGETSLPPNHGAHPPSTKRLNPYFTEHLMGWPAGWTSPIEQPGSSAAEMALYRCRLARRLSCLFAE